MNKANFNNAIKILKDEAVKLRDKQYNIETLYMRTDCTFETEACESLYIKLGTEANSLERAAYYLEGSDLNKGAK